MQTAAVAAATAVGGDAAGEVVEEVAEPKAWIGDMPIILQRWFPLEVEEGEELHSYE
jgi:hypothetical protein